MDSVEKIRAKLFGKATIKEEKPTYECIACGKVKEKFGEYCNMTCYYKVNFPW